MPSIATARGTIYYADHRRDGATTPPLILIHGAAGTHLDWSMPLRKLNSIAPDLPGHGKSPAPGRTAIADYAADMIVLMDTLELPSAVLAGQSMGGAIALLTALDYRDRVQGLILTGTGAKLTVHPRILENIQTDPSAVGRLFKEWMWAKTTPDEIRQRGYELFMRIDPEVAYNDYAACNQFDVRARLGEIQLPTLVIGAKEDQMMPFRYSAYLADHIAGAQLVEIEGAGHMMVIEAADQVAKAVQAWLAQ